MYERLKKATYRALNPSLEPSRAGRVFEFFILTLIALNVIAVVVETIQEVEVSYKPILWNFEVFSVAVFTVEYILRLWVCPVDPKYGKPILGRIRYLFSYLAIIDLLAILPFYLPVLLPFDFRFLRVIRLFRLLRLFKLSRYSRAMASISLVLRAKRGELGIVIMVVFVFLLLSSAIMYEVEREAQPHAFPNIPSAMWWGVVTLTTVGYGDVYPVTATGKFFGAIIALLGIGLFALPAGIIASGFTEQLHSMTGNKKVCPHCGKDISQ
jgi:voltage-gated potassium channel